VRRCLSALCLALGLFAAAPLHGAVEGFESGTGQWVPSGLWHRITSPDCVTPHAGAACMYFGRSSTCDYNDGLIKDASLTSGPVNLTDPARAFVSFWYLYQVESEDPVCYDQLRLEISNDGRTWSLLQKLSTGSDPPGGSPNTGLASGSGLGGTPLWQFKHVDLSAYLGLTVYLRFRFVSSGHQAGDSLCLYTDADFDNFLGYAVDDINFYDTPEPVSLVKAVAPPFGPAGTALSYTLVASNHDAASQTLSLWDTLPPGTLFVSADHGGAPSGGLVQWSLPGVAPGASVTVSLQVQVSPTAAAPQDILNIASAASSAPGLGQDSSPALFRLRLNGFSLKKTVNPTVATNADQVTYNIVLENYSSVTQSSLVLLDELPSGFLVLGSGPAINGSAQWPLSPMVPGDVRSFSLWGPAYGVEGQILVNTAVLQQGSSDLAQASASLLMHKPIEPQVFARGVYPNPAPSKNGAFGYGVHIAFENNQTMPLFLDIFSIAGEKVRSIPVDGTRGVHDAFWDLKNDWGNGVASGVYLYHVWSNTAVHPTPEVFGYIAVLR
jgi:uncharacterized repeat protein (TIGR01451 family)